MVDNEYNKLTEAIIGAIDDVNSRLHAPKKNTPPFLCMYENCHYY